MLKQVLTILAISAATLAAATDTKPTADVVEKDTQALNEAAKKLEQDAKALAAAPAADKKDGDKDAKPADKDGEKKAEEKK